MLGRPKQLNLLTSIILLTQCKIPSYLLIILIGKKLPIGTILKRHLISDILSELKPLYDIDFIIVTFNLVFSNLIQSNPNQLNFK